MSRSRRKPRKRRVGATVLVSLAVVIGALWALDNWARQQVADQVSEEVEQLLDLDDSEPVTVEIAGISVIAHNPCRTIAFRFRRAHVFDRTRA